MTPAIALFDLGDVVAAWDPAPRIAEYARRAGLEPAEVRARLARDDFWTRTDRGDFTADEMAAGICERLGLELSRAELLALQAVAFTPRPEVVDLARRVAARTRVGLLTNNAPLLEQALPLHFSDVVRVFDPILFSYQLGHVKPEPELYAAVQRRLALAPGEILFIDDQPGHVAAARAAGWRALRFESSEQLEGDLRACGLPC